MNMIKKSILVVIATSAMTFGATAAFAVEDIVASAREGCQKEIDTYCKDVTEGEGRVAKCLAAHEDKLSARCNYMAYDAFAQLERLTMALKYIASECKADLDKHCSDIAIGDGRIAKCLKQNEATLAASCKQSLKDTQMEVK
jgi:hypothetical protein